MQATKTVEFKAAMNAYQSVYLGHPTMTERLSAMTHYHHALDKLVCRMLDEMGCNEFNRQRDREVSEGYSYYTVSFKRSDGVLHMLAKTLGLDGIPRFDTSANMRIDVDMTPTDVVAEVKQLEWDSAKVLDSARDALVKLSKEEETLSD